VPRKFRVFWSEAAEDDLLGVLEYIAVDNPVLARKKLNEIKQKVGNLYAFPERGRIVPELLAQGIVIYREFIVPPWRIIYRITTNKVYVLSVLDSRRNIEDILLSRLTRQTI
jgi:toxin ParE1/3/4